jgi:hypothetical protein
MTPCSLCRPSWPCPFHTPEAADHRRRYYEVTADLRGHDIDPDHNGLQIHSLRYINHARRMRMEEVAA